MSNSDKNIVITPNRGQTAQPKIVFTGQENTPITLSVLDNNTISFDGYQGQLFAISHNLSSGTIFSVNDISGIPSIRVNANGTVGIAEFSGNVGIGITNPVGILDVKTPSNTDTNQPRFLSGSTTVGQFNEIILGAAFANYRSGIIRYINGQGAAGSSILQLFNTGDAGGAGLSIYGGTTGIVANEVAADADFRIEGIANQNLFFVDASTDRVGIGTSTPQSQFQVGTTTVSSATGAGTMTVAGTDPSIYIQENDAGTDAKNWYFLAQSGVFYWGLNNDAVNSGANYVVITRSGNRVSSIDFQTGTTPESRFLINSSETALNDNASDRDFRVEGSGTRPNLLLVDAGTARVGVNRAAGTHGATLDIDNLAVAESIFIARDNSTAVFTIADGGDTTIAPVTGHASDALTITGGTLATGKAALNITATLPTTNATQNGISASFTTSAGSAGTRYGTSVSLTGGATQAASMAAGNFTNSATGTGVTPIQNSIGNISVRGFTSGSTAGNNVGGLFASALSTSKNYGTISVGSGSSTATSIGAYGTAFTAGTGFIIGGMFTLYSNDTVPISASSALIADNAAQAVPIFQGRDNGGVLFTIDDGSGKNTFGSTEVVLNDDGYNIDFRVEGDTNANLLFVDASTDRVGIGTATPNARMSISTAASEEVLTLTNTGAANWVQMAITRIDDVQQQMAIKFVPAAAASTSTPWWYFGVKQNTPNFSIQTWDGTALTERIVVATNGNVGIGTTNPATKLHVLTSSATSTTVRFERLAADGGGIQLDLKNSDGETAQIAKRRNSVTLADQLLSFTSNGTADDMVIRPNGDIGMGTGVTTMPAGRLEVRKDTNGDAAVHITNANGGTASRTILFVAEGTASGGNYGYFSHNGAGYTTSGLNVANRTYLVGADTGGLLIAGARGDIIMSRGDTTNTTQERLRVGSIEVAVNEQAQDVDFRIEGQTDANLFFTDASTNLIGIGTNAPQHKLHVLGSTVDERVVSQTTNTSGTAYVSARTGPAATPDQQISLVAFGTGVAGTTMGYANADAVMLNSAVASRMFIVSNSVAQIIIGPKGTEVLTLDGATYGMVHNEAAGDLDARFEGTTDANLVFIDASTNNVGIGTNAPTSKLHINGSVTLPIVTKTTNYTATSADHTMLCDANTGSITITLPTAVGISGRVYVIKKVDSSANTVIVDGNASELIDGALTQTLTAIYESITIQSNGSAWYII